MPSYAVHFISGLPRSGSTLLSAILRQNPSMRAGVSSPVYSLWMTALPKMSGASEFSSFFDDARRSRILRGLLDSFHGAPCSEAPVTLLDTNRSWTSKMALLKSVYPQSKVICCVRDVGAILNSLETALRSNPSQTSRTFSYKPTTNVYSRAEILMNIENGLVGSAWASLREAWFSEWSSDLLIVDYDRLVSSPDDVISRLYAELSLMPHPHDFNNVSFRVDDYDLGLGMPGLHEVEPIVRATPRASILPPDLIEKHRGANFWRNAAYQERVVMV